MEVGGLELSRARPFRGQRFLLARRRPALARFAVRLRPRPAVFRAPFRPRADFFLAVAAALFFPRRPDDFAPRRRALAVDRRAGRRAARRGAALRAAPASPPVVDEPVVPVASPVSDPTRVGVPSVLPKTSPDRDGSPVPSPIRSSVICHSVLRPALARSTAGKPAPPRLAQAALSIDLAFPCAAPQGEPACLPC